MARMIAIAMAEARGFAHDHARKLLRRGAIQFSAEALEAVARTYGYERLDAVLRHGKVELDWADHRELRTRTPDGKA